MREDAVQNFTKFWACITFAMLCALCSTASAALKPKNPTQSEATMLPAYCTARDVKGRGGDPTAYRYWEQLMGVENFDHVHHYCWGLNYMRRAQFEADRQARLFYLQESISNLDYVIKQWKPDFKLAISARKYKAQAEMELRRLSASRPVE